MVNLVLLVSSCDQDENRLFQLLSPEFTGVDFKNFIKISDSLNIMEFDYLYDGAGVAIGDFNNDDLQDIFFVGNDVSCRLYINKGSMQFQDVTEISTVNTSVWSEGATVVDINNDGFLDIYVSTSDGYSGKPHPNLLFVNEGLNSNGIPIFEEKAAEYGIDDPGYNTQAAFFDYDKDGDLDLYVLSNALVNFNRNTVRPKNTTGSEISRDKLYCNNGDGTFTNVSKEAGIIFEGFGLGLVISDINKDSWPDIYVSNDFITNDLLYINNGDGTFTNSIEEMMKHQSHNGMGADIADYNNDGYPDVVVLDMMPDDNQRLKSMMFPFANYDRFTMSLKLGYQPQYVRNTLQLNNGNGSFSEIGQLAGIHQTDWSWAPLFADFDNDGFKDLFVTNGYGKDITDMDYLTFNSSIRAFGSEEAKKEKLRKEIDKLIEVKISNYMYRNTGGLTFVETAKEWGVDHASIANAAVYSDLDNDGDQDLIINNLNDQAFIYQNNLDRLFEDEKNKSNYLKVDLNGSSQNLQGLGSKIEIYYSKGGKKEKQYYEHFPVKGYKSSVGDKIHFGLGEVTQIDSLLIIWPDDKQQLLTNIKANQEIILNHSEADDLAEKENRGSSLLFEEVSDIKNIDYKHQANDFIDFKIQGLLPHKLSENGPGLAVGDVNTDGLEDFYVGGSPEYPGKLFIQNPDNTFSGKVITVNPVYDDMGALFFDVDNDQDLDLYVVSGGNRYAKRSANYQDRLYENDGKGNFRLNTEALPEIITSGSVVTAADYDRDGDLDLFIGGRHQPHRYPMPAKSYILNNENGTFKDVTKEVCPDMEELGLVTSAIWSDVDQDHQMDLVVVGEWMPITIFKQENHDKVRFVNATDKVGLAGSEGWWNSITGGDFDNDGDIDFVAGNLGLNSRYKASDKEPVTMFAQDFDNNGSIDPIMFDYHNGENYPVHRRDVLLEQIVSLRKRFPSYKAYGEATIDNFFREGELDGALTLSASELRTSYIENLGNGNFKMKSLPIEMQFSPVNGILVRDFNNDGNLDILSIGNSYATEIYAGRYDASVGNYLKGDGKGNFKPVPSRESGFFVDGDAKAMAELVNSDGGSIILASQQKDSLKAVKAKNPDQLHILALDPLDQYAKIFFSNGEIRMQEFYYGSSYLSQSSRVLKIDARADSVIFYDYQGKSRKVNLINKSSFTFK